MAEYYARFQRSNGVWLPGDHITNGQHWITLNGWEVAHPTVLRRSTVGRGAVNSVVRGIILMVRGLTAAAYFSEAAATGRPFPMAEIEAVEVHRGQEQRYLLIHMTNVIIAGVSQTKPASHLPGVPQRVQAACEKIEWTFTPVPSQPVPPTDLLRLRG